MYHSFKNLTVLTPLAAALFIGCAGAHGGESDTSERFSELDANHGLEGENLSESNDELEAEPDPDAPHTDSTGRSLTPLAQSIVALNGGATHGIGLGARVEVQPGELLEFYEYAPGRILLSGAGAPDGPPLSGTHAALPQSAEDFAVLWEHASLGAPMPTALADSMSRFSQRLLDPEQFSIDHPPGTRQL